MGFRRYKAGTGNNNKPTVRKVTPASHKQKTKHENVIHSPNANNTLMIKATVAGVTQKMRDGKILSEFSIRELHNSMVGSVEEGGLNDARNS